MIQYQASEFTKGTVILLCNLTMNMARPWLDAGYRVVMVDPQHQATKTDGQVETISDTIIGAMPRLSQIIRTENVVFVFGFPPCTDVAVSGARWFEEKRKKDPHFQAKAALVAEQCRMLGLAAGCPWGFENPASVFSSIFGKSQHTFHPHQYTGYCKEDNYTKLTCVWSGGGFVMPLANKDCSLGAPDDRIHKCPPSDDRGNIRSQTPIGFAIAVFETNRPDVNFHARDGLVLKPTVLEAE